MNSQPPTDAYEDPSPAVRERLASSMDTMVQNEAKTDSSIDPDRETTTLCVCCGECHDEALIVRFSRTVDNAMIANGSVCADCAETRTGWFRGCSCGGARLAMNLTIYARYSDGNTLLREMAETQVVKRALALATSGGMVATKQLQFSIGGEV